MATIQPFPEPETAKPKRPLRPLFGIPDPERRGRAGWVVSGLLHALIILALLLPPLVGKILEEQAPGGAGGAGEAGGGGGGSGGTGGAIVPERIRYLQVQTPVGAPTPPPVTPIPTPTPVPTPPPEPVPEPQAAQPQVAAPASSPAVSATPGTGGGSGRDGSAGSGSGSGGGVGSGIGTGRGSGVGAGTGGGNDQIFPPTVTNMAILPIPVPNRVRPYRMVAQFEVDERGNAKLIGFNPSRDRGYNVKIREMLAEMRFRPATRVDGTPVRDTATITAEAP